MSKNCWNFLSIEPIILFFDSILMGCFISCFRPRDKSKSQRARSITSSVSTSDSNYLIENLVKKEDQEVCGVKSQVTERKEIFVEDDLLNQEIRQEKISSENVIPKDSSSFEFQSESKGSKEIVAEEDELHEELRQEAKQLKLCGVIPQTPVEIKKSMKRRAFQELNGSPKSSQSLIASDKMIQFSGKIEHDNQLEKHILSLKENAESDFGSIEFKKGPKHDRTPAQLSAKFQVNFPTSKSPLPTPLILRDEMETPLTQHPSYMETPRTGKRARIRAQYIFPASKQLEISSGEKTGDGVEGSNGVKIGEESGNFLFGAGKAEEETPKVSVASLSEWLKPASNWGVWNGIPNSNTKYKEDQKVKWHATPFEERLEKVLSEEKNNPRKLMSKRLIELEE